MLELDALKIKPVVLVIEDEMTQRRILTNHLEREGYHVLSAEDGEEGLVIWRENPKVRVIITDLLMPNIDGFGVVEQVRKDEAHYTYIIVLTSLSERQGLVRALTLGADDYVTKPIFKEELLLRLQGAARLLRLEGQDELVFALAEMAAYRSGETGLHLSRVKEYCHILSEDLRYSNPELGLSKSAVEDIASVSPLHDIGKVGIPDYVLHKPGRLTADEYELMKTHASMGGKILMDLYKKNGSNFLLLGHDIAMYHHEKWDGSGYPQGLAGEEIPLAARIMALADVFDALTSQRCYKDAYSFDRARSIINEERGRHFDPTVVDSCQRMEEKMLAVQEKFQEQDFSSSLENENS